MENKKNELKGRYVQIGNGKGEKLSADIYYLKTSDLDTCTAVLGYLPDDKSGFLIHSDANNSGGQGSVDLRSGLEAMGYGDGTGLKIGLIGQAVKAKKEVAQDLWPKCEIVVTKAGESAYLTSDGQMVSRKADLTLGPDQVLGKAENDPD